MSTYSDTLTKLEEGLVSQYTTIFKHHGDRGDSREKAVIEYLSKVSPERYGFSKGEIFDAKGNNSGETDIIIYDRVFSSVFRDVSEKILAPIESTFGIIEVKSSLTKSELESSIKKLEKYNNLERKESEENEAYFLPDISLRGGSSISLPRTKNQRVNMIFAYKKDINVETLFDIAKSCDILDCIVIPGEFCYIGRPNSGGGFEKDGIKLEPFLCFSENSVAIWVLYLQMLLSMSKLISIEKKGLMLELLASTKIHSESYDTEMAKRTPSTD